MEHYSTLVHNSIVVLSTHPLMDTWNTFALLVECRLIQPLWEAVWRYLRKLKLDLPFDPLIPFLGIYPKKCKALIQKNISTPMFTAALFTITKMWKQRKCPSVDKITMGHLHNGILLSHKKEENVTLCNNTDGPGEHYAKWNMPVRERRIAYDFTHMWNLMKKLN